MSNVPNQISLESASRKDSTETQREERLRKFFFCVFMQKDLLQW